MSMEKQNVVGQIEILESGVVQVRTDSRILENGQILASSFHRHAILPGADFSNEDERVQAVCRAVHTPEVILEYEKALQES